MSLKPEPSPSVPEPTARLAHIVCPKGNVCLWISEELSAVFQDELFDSFFPCRGQPAEAPWRLAVVTVLQFVKDFLIDKRQRPCGPELTGNMRCV
jgi:transposase